MPLSARASRLLGPFEAAARALVLPVLTPAPGPASAWTPPVPPTAAMLAYPEAFAALCAALPDLEAVRALDPAEREAVLLTVADCLVAQHATAQQLTRTGWTPTGYGLLPHAQAQALMATLRHADHTACGTLDAIGQLARQDLGPERPETPVLWRLLSGLQDLEPDPDVTPVELPRTRDPYAHERAYRDVHAARGGATDGQVISTAALLYTWWTSCLALPGPAAAAVATRLGTLAARLPYWAHERVAEVLDPEDAPAMLALLDGALAVPGSTLLARASGRILRSRRTYDQVPPPVGPVVQERITRAANDRLSTASLREAAEWSRLQPPYVVAPLALDGPARVALLAHTLQLPEPLDAQVLRLLVTCPTLTAAEAEALLDHPIFQSSAVGSAQLCVTLLRAPALPDARRRQMLLEWRAAGLPPDATAGLVALYAADLFAAPALAGLLPHARWRDTLAEGLSHPGLRPLQLRPLLTAVLERLGPGAGIDHAGPTRMAMASHWPSASAGARRGGGTRAPSSPSEAGASGTTAARARATSARRRARSGSIPGVVARVANSAGSQAVQGAKGSPRVFRSACVVRCTVPWSSVARSARPGRVANTWRTPGRVRARG